MKRNFSYLLTSSLSVLFCFQSVFSHTAYFEEVALIDSLQLARISTKSLTDQELDSLIALSSSFTDQMLFEDAQALNEALISSLKHKTTSRLGKIHQNQGYNFSRQRDLNNAISSYEKAIRILSQLHDKELSTTLLHLGKSYYDLGDYTQSIQTYETALQEARKTKDQKNIALSLTGIGIVLSDQGKRHRALDYFKESLQNYISLQDSANMTRSYFDIGEIKYLVRELDSAKYFFNQSNRIAEALKDELVQSYCFHRLGSLYLIEQQFDTAEHYLHQSLEIRKRLNYPLETALTQIELSKLYQQTDRFSLAIASSEAALKLSNAIPFLKGQHMANQQLSEAHELQQNYPRALEYYKAFKATGDSLLSDKNNKEIERAYTRLQVEKQTQLLNLKQKQQKQLYLSLVILISCIGFTVVMYFIRQRKRTKRKYEHKIIQKETEAEKNILLQLNKERRRISRDVHDDLGSSISGTRLLSELIFNKTQDPQLKKEHAKLLQMQKETTQKIRDIIWVLNHDNNTLENLSWYCHSYAENLLKSFQVTFSSTIADDIPLISIDNESRKNFFLCVKEAINNILKHAKANRVSMDISFESNRYTICINDNGKGFDPLLQREIGHGLQNMKKRMKTIGGELKLESNSKGTTVCFSKYYPK